MNLYEILQNPDRVGEGMTHFERLFAQKVGGGKINEIFGVPPLRYIGDGRPLTDYRIAGNTVQDGTPSAEDPVDATGSGVRTGNLFDKTSDTINNNGQVRPGVKVSSGTYSINNTTDRAVYYRIGNERTTIQVKPERKAENIIASDDLYVWRDNGVRQDGVMLNLGSTALPYEPYGFKLPLTVNSTEYPIYLGHVETTRRIKKLVLDGAETWYAASTSKGNTRFTKGGTIDANADARSNIVCTHLAYNPDYNNVCVFITSTLYLSITMPGEMTVAAFKSYLAQQYAAGTPVTVWYVLATPETAVVNEPLMKIGDYADTLSFAQAGVTIPTVNGENVLDVPTQVKPSGVWIRGKIKEV